MYQGVIESWADLEGAVTATETAFDDYEPWWRGHADAEWKLCPPVFRDGRGDTPEHEQGLLHNFMAGAGAVDSACPGIDETLSWLVLARHHGLHTRLLDWTQSLLTAVFFALEEADGTKDAAVWALWPSGLGKAETNEEVVYCTPDSLPRDLAEEAKEGTNPSLPKGVSVIPFAPHHTTPRMRVQTSMFTLHRGPKAMEERSDAPTLLRRYIIPREAQESLRAALGMMQLNRGHYFPDLDGLAAQVNQSYFE